MSRYEAAPWLRDLTTFQCRSVEHVIEQLYGPADAGRFLVADETGLGKTRVARGVIARAIEHLQDSVPRIDIVYVCSNTDLARQNIRRLNVTGEKEIPFSSRLTLLGEHSRRLDRPRESGPSVNLVSFTPGTSFDMGHSLGQARERAMIAIALIDAHDMDGYQRTATLRLLQGTVRELATFRSQVDWLRSDLGARGIDPAIREEFRKRLDVGGRTSLRCRFVALVSEMGRKRSIPETLRGDALSLVRDLRAALAAASVETLQPDLVILDEFQRFRHLLSDDNPSGELAHHLFGYEGAKVLLLSATPYKPFTLAGEDGDDHARDLSRTLDFLARGRDDVEVEDIRRQLQSYREALLSARPATSVTTSLREDLLKLMSRAERPTMSTGSMTVERATTASDLRATDLSDFATARRVGDLVRRPGDQALVTAEYWKSAPYFLTFCDGYQLGRRLRDAEPTADLQRATTDSRHVERRALERFEPLDAGNARMRLLVSETLDRGWWNLLWLPSSMTYIEPTGPFADPAARTMTKRLVFSSWTATPSSVASILSYEAERRAVADSDHYTSYTPEARAKLARRLQFAADRDGKPKQMAAFLCFWPLQGLAEATDPLTWVAATGGEPLTRAQALVAARRAVDDLLAAQGIETGKAQSDHLQEQQESVWRAAFGWDGSWPEASDSQIAQAISGSRADLESDGSVADPGDIPNGVAHHVAAARGARDERHQPLDVEARQVLAELGLHSPANIAYRALKRLGGRSADVTQWGLFDAAATLANGLRSLFNRPDAVQVVERLGDAPRPYWRKMLDYIAMGDLEAVLDEYCFQIYSDRAAGPATDALLREVAREVAEAVSLRSPTLRAIDADDLNHDLAFTARFALRYGGRQQDAEDSRQPEVRRAFNSPFWPMVLASTSVGQEGIDFHWWCHAVFHWNTPSNPVDFEQREGRVDRFRGHAVRKNVALAHGRAALSQTTRHPWDQVYELATDHRAELGDFSPGWVYPGPHQIERHVAPFPFSTDLARYAQLNRTSSFTG